MSEILETTMLICFGFSWPISVIKNIKSKTSKAMSMPFILLIITGYIAGISSKLINGRINYVLIVYLINLAFVSLNLAVYFINRRLDKKMENNKTVDLSKIEENKDVQEVMGNYLKRNAFTDGSDAVFYGTNLFCSLPIEEYSASLASEKRIYNRSFSKMNIDDACKNFEKVIIPLNPGTLFLYFGENEIENSDFKIDDFISKYEWLLYTASCNSVSKTIIVTIKAHSKRCAELNEKLENLAKNYGCEYLQIDGYPENLCEIKSCMSRFMPHIRNISFADAMKI